jgi:hypothetical protein
MTDWKQFLTKQILKESSFTNTVTISCDGRVWLPRTYDNRNDLMDLYEAIYRDEVNIWKWREFCDLSASKDYFYVDSLSDDYAEWTEWLFCLDGKGYEDRCKMVSEFYGFREE